MTRRLAELVMLLLTLALALPDLVRDDDPPRGIPRDAEPAVVRSVVDGDTFRVTLADGTKATVRLLGIDAPETKDPGEPVGCYGPEASDRLAKLLPAGSKVWLEQDKTDRDRNDRLLRYVWVKKNNGGRYLVNEVMVRDGYGLANRFAPDEARLDRIEAAQDRAVAAGRGLWSACPGVVAGLTPVPNAGPALAGGSAVTPGRIQIPALGVDAAVESVGIVDGVMQTPVDPWSVGWYGELGGPGGGGNTVMAGHRDWYSIGPVVFYDLGALGAGDEVRLLDGAGNVATYVVYETVAVDASTPASDVIGGQGGETLTLITCGGEFAAGEYDLRIIVRARRV